METLAGAGRPRGVLATITRAESSPITFAVVLALTYVIAPLGVHAWVLPNDYFVELAALAGLGAVGVVVGARVPLLDRLEGLPRRIVDLDAFVAVIWLAFGLFVLVAMVTAERIPFVAALQGADAETVAVLRERFLKAREGWQAVFPYVNAVLAGALVPYALVLALVRGHRLRWLLFLAFLVYCLSFVEKVFFLRAVIPLAYVVAQQRVRVPVRARTIFALSAGLIVLITTISGFGAEADAPAGDGEEFFSAKFAPQGTMGFLAWRAVAIPIVTAADTLRVFDEDFARRPLLGATSSLIAGVLGRERVNIEREVFALQWGQNETETGSANSVFLTEAYLNFGLLGVMAFSVAAGMLLRIFARSRDEPLRSLWMFFCFALFVGPLTGTLFSNGFLLVIAVSLLTEIRDGAAEPPAPSRAASA